MQEECTNLIFDALGLRNKYLMHIRTLFVIQSVPEMACHPTHSMSKVQKESEG